MTPGQPGPQQPVAYPRGQQAGLDTDKLRALADGYFGLTWVFVVNVVLALGVGVARVPFMNSPDAFMLVSLIGLVVLFIAIGVLSFFPNRKIAYGKGWPVGLAVLASFLIGINSVLCCGIIGYFVMQSIALGEIRARYGLKAGFFGLKKRDVEARLAQLRAESAVPQRPGYQP